jgi:HNH endonuclease
MIRTISYTVTGRDETFRLVTRARDKKCVISGVANSAAKISRNEWDIFEAAHVFPLASESLFIQGNYSRWITSKTSWRDTGINSIQNGLLLKADVHRLWDQFLISVNPDVRIL